jgi:DNA mismatch repair protein MutL
VDLCDEAGSVRGWISTPDLLWPNRRKLLLFVNRRLVSAPALCHAVSDGVGAGRGRYPMGVLELTVAGDEVDVNVHPTKAEVRFQDAERVFRRVRHSVVRACQAAPGGTPSTWLPPPPNADWRNAALEPFAAWPDPRPDEPSGATRAPVMPLRGGLVAVVQDGALWIVDPHVVQERRLRAALTQGHGVGLVFPLMMEMLNKDAERLARGLPGLEARGFVLERFGTTTFLVRRVPVGCERLVDDQRLQRLLSTALASGEDWLDRFVREAPCEAVPQAVDVQQLVLDLTEDDWVADKGAHGRAGAVVAGPETLLRWLEMGGRLGT